MNMKELLILCILQNCEAVSAFSAMTVQEILCSDEVSLDVKNNTLYKLAMDLLRNGLIRKGLKNGRQVTFYITEKGIKKIGECR